VIKWSEFLTAYPGAQIRFPALLDFLRSSESGTGSNQPREYNRGSTWGGGGEKVAAKV
jgi:hypothetical protein